MSIYLIALSFLVTPDPFLPKSRPGITAARLAEWEDVLSPIKLDDRLAHYLVHFDPRKDDAFVPFRDEWLHPHMVYPQDKASACPTSSWQWFDIMLSRAANPLADETGKPVSYSLPPTLERLSLLRYESTLNGTRLVIQESAYGVAVFLEPAGWTKRQALRREELNRLLDQIPSRRYRERERAITPPVPEEAKPGLVVSNHPYFGNGWLTSERSYYLCMVTNRGVVIFMLKPYPVEIATSMAGVGWVDDKAWVPAKLFAADRQTLLMVKKFGDAYAPPKPQKK